jgi:hypothetical protein
MQKIDYRSYSTGTRNRDYSRKRVDGTGFVSLKSDYCKKKTKRNTIKRYDLYLKWFMTGSSRGLCEHGEEIISVGF